MDEMENYRIALIFIMLGWGFNGFAFAGGQPVWLQIYVLGPLALCLTLLVDSFTFAVLKTPAQAAWFWAWGV